MASIGQTLGEMGEAGQPFINMIENGPVVGEDLEQIGGDIGKLAAVWAPFGLDALTTFTEVVNTITSLMVPFVEALESPTHAIQDFEDVWDCDWGHVQQVFSGFVTTCGGPVVWLVVVSAPPRQTWRRSGTRPGAIWSVPSNRPTTT
jgi:hypothetical protein